jgi:formylglycine-generating enzyme required for sulfatase activity
LAEPLPPIGFWSYTSSDDTASGGRLSQLRRKLANELQLHVWRRHKVHIFQDVAAVPHGTDWLAEIHKALAQSSFLIPIVTRAFLESEMCCQEVLRFREHERELGRAELVFPFRYINTDMVHPDEVHDKVVLAFLNSRQWVDFSPYCLRRPNTDGVAITLARLAESINAALRHDILAEQKPNKQSVPRVSLGLDERFGKYRWAIDGFAGKVLLRREPSVDEAIQAGPAHKSPQSALPELPRPAINNLPTPCTVMREGPAPEMVLIPVGRFMMVSPASERERWHDEGPVHRVTISQPFWLGRYPVTRAEYAEFVNEAGHEGDDWKQAGFLQDDRHPVVNVSHTDAEAYVTWLSAKTGQTYRLPSEAEWEYAARAGTTTARYWGEAAGRPNQCARFSGEFRDAGGTARVGSYYPNPFGLYDMLGNVWEWCADAWHGDYQGAPTDGSAWATNNSVRRVIRGGAWDNTERFVRAGYRFGFDPANRDDNLGFRLARVQGQASGAG